MLVELFNNKISFRVTGFISDPDIINEPDMHSFSSYVSFVQWQIIVFLLKIAPCAFRCYIES